MARCTFRGCPVRYAGGDDRPCLDHRSDGANVAATIEAWKQAMAAPGDLDDEQTVSSDQRP